MNSPWNTHRIALMLHKLTDISKKGHLAIDGYLKVGIFCSSRLLENYELSPRKKRIKITSICLEISIHRVCPWALSFTGSLEIVE